MINSVRNTVLSILNKNNYGYLSPSDFNLFAKQAQLEIFDEYVYKYNKQVNMVNARMSGTGYADIEKLFEEFLDAFLVSANLSHDANNEYFMPSLTTTGSDFYRVESVHLLDNGGNIIADLEKVRPHDINMLLASNMTAPSTMFPAYYVEADKLFAYPSATINAPNLIKAVYLRYPKDPKWTYISLSGGEPVFSQSQPDYQDFEIPIDEEPNLVIKILQYAGLSIREYQIAQAAKLEEQSNIQTQ